jgi:RNA polymerase sigma factor (TIGR02999 family)
MPWNKDGDTPADFDGGYAKLRKIAGSYVRRFSDSQTMQATALVHEVYLKLAKSRQFADQEHFVCTAATAMRQILVDHARARQRVKRGGEFSRVTMNAIDIAAPGSEVDVLVLNDALQRLAAWDARQARIVELRFFIGLSVEEAAQLLSISEKTVKRDWAMARAWLQKELAQ